MSAAIIHAVIQLLPGVSGHRASGWRSVCRFDSIVATDGADVFGVEVELLGPDRIEPGERADCRLRLWAADNLPGPVAAGTSLLILEGTKEVATGQVVSFTKAGDA